MKKLLLLLTFIIFSIIFPNCFSLANSNEASEKTESKYEEIASTPIPVLNKDFIRGMDV
mgnify:CR=1 FL=1